MPAIGRFGLVLDCEDKLTTGRILDDDLLIKNRRIADHQIGNSTTGNTTSPMQRTADDIVARLVAKHSENA